MCSPRRVPAVSLIRRCPPTLLLARTRLASGASALCLLTLWSIQWLLARAAAPPTMERASKEPLLFGYLVCDSRKKALRPSQLLRRIMWFTWPMTFLLIPVKFSRTPQPLLRFHVTQSKFMFVNKILTAPVNHTQRKLEKCYVMMRRWLRIMWFLYVYTNVIFKSKRNKNNILVAPCVMCFHFCINLCIKLKFIV